MQRSGSQRARAANATAAAQSYAPKPNGSTITYGLIAASLLLVVAFLAGGYFAVDIVANAWPLAGLTVLAFLAGGVLRFWRQKEHSGAIAREFAKRGPRFPQPAPPSDAVGSMSRAGYSDEEPTGGPEIVTFTSPFTLPGLDRPYPPGSYRVWERREPLDVSWDAFMVTKTIMLTSRGTVEALDVKAGDLAAALDRDRKASGEQR
jgi:hypothetical protein